MATIEKKGGVIIIRNYNSDSASEDEKTKIITDHTANTWQPDRGAKEKLADTKIGKIAETLFEEYVKQYKLLYWSYDSFRKNNFEKHAPFDGLIFREQKKELAAELVKRINTEISASDYGKVSTGLLSDLSSSKIFTVEVKPTRITDRHKTNGDYDIAKIKSDDFLAYPHDLRSTSRDFNLSTYADFLIQNGKINVPAGQDKIAVLKKYEMQFMMDIYVRVYIDEANKTGIIMGYITKGDFVANATIKKMFLKGKSELPIYLATTITNGKSVDEISNTITN